MLSAALPMLGLESAVLAAVVLGMYRLRRHVSLTPLYVMLGVFQPLQVMLAATVYVDLWPGLPLSPASLMFAASLLAVLLVYIREDAGEARKVIYGVVGANLAMTLVLFVASLQLRTPGTDNVLGVAPGLFGQGGRVSVVGTLTLVADVALLILVYGATGARLRRHPALRVWLTLTGVLVFDAVAFSTGVFLGRDDYLGLLGASVLGKLVVGTLFSLVLVGYLRFIEPATVPEAVPGHLRDFFYAFTYRDKFELQAQHHARERAQVFERITDAFVALDRDWHYTYVNQKAAQIFGRRAEDLVGRHIWTEFPEGEDQAFAEAYRRAMADQQPMYFEAYYPPYDRWFENRIYPSPDGLTIYFHDTTERVRQQQELQRHATRDETTGPPNRRAMREALDAMLEERPRHHPVGVLLLNIDRLHHINDTLGYAAGDEVLREVARRLIGWAEVTGWQVGSAGGDTFLLMREMEQPHATLEPVARQAMLVVAQPYLIASQPVYLTCSGGASWFPEAGRTAAHLLEQADLALNVAKQRGRNHVCLFSQERADDIFDRLNLTARMRQGLEHDAFHLCYQPVVEAASGRIVGAEALMRWDDPELGAIGPARFIPIAEDTGVIVRIGDWALQSAIADLAAWLAKGAPSVPLSVNVSAVQFQRRELVAEIDELLREARIPPGLLKLEITESVLMEDTRAAVAQLDELRALGVRIALDDFGTGYSNLALLRQLPIDEIKIDRSFVRDIGTDRYAATLCRAIIAMSHDLHFTVVAEGVETPAEAKFLADAGCHRLQGYLFSRAVDASALAQMLAADTRWSTEGHRSSRNPA